MPCQPEFLLRVAVGLRRLFLNPEERQERDYGAVVVEKPAR